MERIPDASVMNSMHGMSVARLEGHGTADATAHVLSNAAAVDCAMNCGSAGRQDAKRQQVSVVGAVETFKRIRATFAIKSLQAGDTVLCTL